jgi:signal transduction histidine kinase
MQPACEQGKERARQVPKAPHIAALLRCHQDEIATAWVEMAHGLPATRYGERPAKEIRPWVSRGVTDAIQTVSTGLYQASEAYLADVSATCLALGIGISEAIEGLWLFKDAAQPFIQQAYPAGSVEACEADAHLDSYLRSMISRFSRLYTEAMASHLQAQQQQITSTVESLQRVTTALLQKLTLDQALEIVLHEACHLTGAQGGALLSWDGGDWLVVVRSEGAFQAPSNRWPVAGTFTGRVVQTGTPLLVNDPGDLALRSHPVPDLESLLVIPMHLKGSMVGALYVANKPGGFTQDDMRVLSLFADGAAIALETTRLHLQEEQWAVTEERQRLARDLHDSVTQALYSMTLHAEAASLALVAGKQEVAAKSLQKLATMAREATMDLRMLIFDLRPPLLEEEGLVAALQARLAAVGSRAGLQTEIHVEGEEHLPLSVANELFWIAVEACNNVIKHANAQWVRVGLWFDGPAVCIEIADDGLGFEPTNVRECGGVGLQEMAERAQRIKAELKVTSTPGQGTVVRVEAQI